MFKQRGCKRGAVMRQKWGRERTAGRFPSRKPWWSIAAVTLAVLAGALINDCCYEWTCTPLQKFYAPVFTESADVRMASRVNSYTVLTVVTRGGQRLAVDRDVTGSREYSFKLTQAALNSGAIRLEWQRKLYENASLHGLLRHYIYHDRSPELFAKPALWVGFGVLVVGLALAIPKDLARAKQRKHGRRLKGPELVTAAGFNRRNHSDGIGFLQQQDLFEGPIGRKLSVCIPRKIESSHILVLGDTGTGKSALIRQILLQVEARGDTAIVYDPALEYTPLF